MLSNKAKYALKAAIVLAREFGQGPVLFSDIAQRERIPRKFLELILLEPRHGGILQSRKGKGGGYFLAREPGRVSLGQILRVVEGTLAPIPCVSETGYIRCRECRDENGCAIHIVMEGVRDATTTILDSASLARIASSVGGKEGFGDTHTKKFWPYNRLNQWNKPNERTEFGAEWDGKVFDEYPPELMRTTGGF